MKEIIHETRVEKLGTIIGREFRGQDYRKTDTEKKGQKRVYSSSFVHVICGRERVSSLAKAENP